MTLNFYAISHTCSAQNNVHTTSIMNDDDEQNTM